MAKGSDPKQVKLKSGEVRYRGKVDAGRDPGTGVRRQRTVSASTKREYWEKVAAVRDQHAAGSEGRLLVRDYLLDHWLPWKASQGVRAVTLNRYEGAIRRRLIPAFGHLRLSALERRDVDQWLRRLREEGLADNTRSGVLMVLSQAIRMAYQWRYIERNPCVGVRLGKRAEPAPLRVWTASEAARFLHLTRDDPDGCLWRVLLLGALRVGEAMALTWRDFDPEAGVLQVRATVTTDRQGKLVLGTEAKTRGSRRVVDLDPETVRLLVARKAEASSVLIFPSRDGGVWNAATVRHRLQVSCREHGLPVLSPHSLRHTSITLSLAAGLPLAAVAARAGHSRSSITLDTYSHHLPGQARAVAVGLGELLAREG